MPDALEAGREREALRYEASSIAATIRYPQSQLLSSPPNADFVADPVLTSLAQLAALRLDACGAFISFFDARYQHVLAQATKSSSIFQGRHGDAPAQHQLLGKAIPRPCGFCEDVLLEAGIDGPSLTNGSQAGLLIPVSVVPDITSSPLLSKPVGIPGLPEARFYAAVPIKSPRNINIGVLVVYSPQPRTEIEPRVITFLRDISATVTSYLQTKQTRTALRRSERMVRGLGSFVEGAAGMSFDSTTSNTESFQDEGTEGTLNPEQQDIQRLEREQELQSPFIAQFKAAPRETPQDQTSFTVPTLPPVAPDDHRERPKINSSPESRESEELGPGPVLSSSSTSVRNVDVSESVDGEESEHMASITSLFSRAANIIRESIEVEGVIFVDASVSSFGGLVGTGNNYNSASAHSSSEESLIDTVGDGQDNFCDILGYSTSTSSSVDKNGEPSHQVQVPEKFLKTLLRRYPKGKIYHFSEMGSVSTSGDSSGNETTTTFLDPNVNTGSKGDASGKTSGRRRTSKWSRQHEGASLLKILPDARSVLLIPLWDYNKERWYASGIIWTCKPARAFTREGDLSYLRAFGMSILSELARLEVQIYDKAKSDVLGSLSHELRSPLHGVVAATDLLRDTTLDAFQCDVIHSLESCGRVLLDVLNHLLDYSKVNTFLRDDKAHQTERKGKMPALSSRRSLRHDRLRLLAYTQLDSLLEESIDSVFAGHIFQKLSIAQLDQRVDLNADAMALQRNDTIDAIESFGHQTGSSGNMKIPLGDVCVLVDIDPAVPWRFRTQPGALRRIILNIFGNSMRYTDRGFIVVTLRQEKHLSTRSSHTGMNLKLTITDTGRGIGAYFMQHHLFTPFAQEDRLAPGTGLGLSLVKKIVKNLGGSVTVESQVGVGTCVRVLLPLSGATDQANGDEDINEYNTALSGLRVALVGLNEKTGKTFRDERLMSESELMHKVCSKLLNLQIVELDGGEFRPDLVLCGELGMNELLRDTGNARLSAPIVVLCKDAITSYQHNKSFCSIRGHRIVEFISQPVGPRKLAKSLDTALSRWTEIAQMEMGNIFEPETPRLQPSAFPLPAESSIDSSDLSESCANEDDPKETVPDIELVINDPKTKEVALAEGHQPQSIQPLPKFNKPANNVAGSGERSLGGEQVGLLPGTTLEREILLVDDNPINLRILTSYMKKLKKPYNTATNGLEAFETFAASPSRYSCILMDLSMPVMGGLESTRKIREFERSQRFYSTTTVIALTGLASSSSQMEAFASGVDLYLTKPVRLKDLAQVLADRQL